MFGMGDLIALWGLGPANAAEAVVTPDVVRFGPELEPVVRLIEQTPEEDCAGVMIGQLKNRLPYRQFIAGLYLAAIRAARWHEGMHAFDHNAYVVHSAYRLGLDLPAGEQLLPAFYALLSFKGMQKVYPDKKGMRELTGKLPPAEKAADELRAALEEWDAERAERAVVVLARTRGSAAVLEPLWRYAARTWGFIGHMAILTANSARLLETIGWQHGEPVLRYIVEGFAGWGKEHAGSADVRPYLANLPRAEKAAARLPGNWAEAVANEGLTKDLLAALRDGKGDEACDLAVKHLAEGKAQAGAIWDAVHLAAGELVLSVKPKQGNRPDGNALHANTAANALHYAFRSSTLPDTRLLLTLQALSWMDLYRKSRAKDIPAVTDITALTGKELLQKPEAAINEVLATRTDSPHEAGRLAFALARNNGVEPLLRAARRLLPMKASADPHDIKFPVAIFEDLDLISARWRPHLLAAGVFSFWGTDRPDNARMEQLREAVRRI